MKRLLCIIITFICLVIPVSAQADEGWVIQQFDSDIAVQTDGTVLVTETIKVDFGSLSKHGIYRDLPYTYKSADGYKYTEIKPLAVERDAKTEPFDVQQNGANLRLKIGDAATEISGEHTYKMQYQATGVLQSFAGYDELYWNVTGHDWPVRINAVTAKVTIPSPKFLHVACYQGELGSGDTCLRQPDTLGEQTTTFSSLYLPTGQGLTIAVGFTAGIVPILTATPPPTLLEEIQWLPLLLSFAVVVIGGVGFVIHRWLRYGRDAWYGNRATHEASDEPRFMGWGDKESIAPEFAPPANLRPAELGTLMDERADTLDVSATIVDLAVRGFLTIAEEKKPGLFGGKDYKLTKKKKVATELLPYENKLLTALFATGDEVKLSDLKNKFYKDLAEVKKKLYAEVVKKKFFVKDPEAVRFTYLGWGFGILIVSIFSLVFLMPFQPLGFTFLTILFGVGVGLCVVGAFVIAMSWAMPARTAEGRQLYRQAKGYELFVSNVEKYRAPFMEQKNMFEQVLPYAMVFGVTHQLANAMKTLGVKPTSPTWYHGMHPFSPVVFANDVSTFSSSLSSAMATSPSSSGSSGGGFSGGGFGGGGGGSW